MPPRSRSRPSSLKVSPGSCSFASTRGRSRGQVRSTGPSPRPRAPVFASTSFAGRDSWPSPCGGWRIASARWPSWALPESLYELCDLPDGLVVVCGPTGAGKSTTLATLIDRINRTRRCHIVTIEDPIEYLHGPAQSLVNQRQVGIDTGSFNDALVASLRQDPDVILVGEIRDLATIRTAITAAETGHLVLTTVHAGDCVGAIERLVSVFPADEQTGIRRQLAWCCAPSLPSILLIADGPAGPKDATAAAAGSRPAKC